MSLIKFNGVANLPRNPSAEAIYLDTATNVLYQWDGDSYQTLYFNTDSNGNTVLVGADGNPFLELQAAPATGIAVTDTANLNAAVATVAAAGGGIVRVPVGHYVVNNHIQMLSNVQLVGSGYGSWISMADSTNKNIIYAQSVDNIAIKNLRLDGNRVNNVDNNPSDSVQNCIAVQGALQRVEISGNWIHGAIFHGVFVAALDTENIIVQNNTIYDNGYRPVHMHGDDINDDGTVLRTIKNVRVIGNTCYGNGQHVSSYNVLLSGIFVAFKNMDAVLVSNNLIYNEPGVAIDITGSNAAEAGSVYAVEVTNNIIKNCYYGIQLSNSSSTVSKLKGVNISGNQIYNSHQAGITLSASNAAAVTESINIVGNTLLNTAAPIQTTLAADYVSGTSFTVADATYIQVGMPIVIPGTSWGGSVARVLTVVGNVVTVDVTNTTSVATGVVVHSGLIKCGLYFGTVTGKIRYLNFTGNTIQGFGGDVTISGLSSVGFFCSAGNIEHVNVIGNMIVANYNLAYEGGATANSTYQFRVTGAATYWNITGNQFIGTANNSTVSADIGSAASYIMFTNNICVRAGTSAPVSFNATSSLISNVFGDNAGTPTIAADAVSARILGEATGAGSAALGANCPAVTATEPFTWERIITKDNSVGYIPVWK